MDLGTYNALEDILATAYPGRNIQTDFFTYNVPNFNLAYGASTTGQIQIGADADFCIMQMAYQTPTTADAAYTVNTEPIPNISVSITDTSSGRALMDRPVPLGIIAGTARSPFWLPEPKLIAAKATLQFTFANYDAAVNYSVYFALVGVKVFDLGPITSPTSASH